MFRCHPRIRNTFYYELRNRVCADGSEWLQPEMKTFMSCKLKDENEESHPTKDLYTIGHITLYTGQHGLAELS